MTLDFPGYEAVFPNEVYGRDGQLEMNGEQVPVRHLILPKRYTLPTKEGVFDRIKEAAEDVHGTPILSLPSHLAAHAGQDRGELEELMVSLGPNIAAEIIRGQGPNVNLLKKLIMVPESPDGSPLEYAFVLYGILPIKMIEDNAKAGNIERATWYDTSLPSPKTRKIGFGEEWGAHILLQDGKLYDPVTINQQLQNGTFGSRILTMSRPDYSVDQVREVFAVVYEALKTAEQIDQLTGVSEDKLEISAIKPVEALIQIERENQQEVLELSALPEDVMRQLRGLTELDS